MFIQIKQTELQEKTIAFAGKLEQELYRILGYKKWSIEAVSKVTEHDKLSNHIEIEIKTAGKPRVIAEIKNGVIVWKTYNPEIETMEISGYMMNVEDIHNEDMDIGVRAVFLLNILNIQTPFQEKMNSDCDIDPDAFHEEEDD